MTVQDVTFLANISNLNVTNINQSNPTNTGDLASGFSKVLNDLSASQTEPKPERAIPDTKVSESSVKLDIPNKDNSNAAVDSSSGGKIREQIFGNEAKPMSDEDSTAIEDFEQDVKELIGEAFGVSEEEIDDAMSILGLTIADLVDPQSFIELATELSGSESATELLLNDNFKQLFEDVAALVEELSEAVGVNADELGNLFDTVLEDDASFEEFLNQAPVTDGLTVSEADITKTDEAEAFVVPEQEAKEPPVLQNTEAAPKDLEKTLDIQFQDGAAETEEVLSETTVKTEDTAEPVREFKAPVDGEVSIEEPTDEVVVTRMNVSSESEGDPEEALSQEEGNEQSLLKNTGSEPLPHETTSGSIAAAETVSVGAVETPVTTFQTVVNSATGEQVTQMTQTYVDESGVLEQFVTNVSVNVTPETSDLVMQLNPESLGKIFLHVSEQQGQITAKIAVENEAVRDIMAAQMTAVKDSLSQNGVKIEAVEVSVRAHEFERNLEEGNHEGNEERMFEEQEARRPRRSINLNSLDELSGMMTEEEQIVASMMRDSGNTMDVQA